MEVLDDPIQKVTLNDDSSCKVVGSVEEEMRKGDWSLPIDLSGFPEDVASRMVEAAPFLRGSTSTEYDAKFFSKLVGLCNGGVMVDDVTPAECPDHLWASTWPLHEDGQSARVKISGCKSPEIQRDFRKLYKKVYGQRPDNGFFPKKFVRAATLHLILKQPVNFAECASKLTKDRIRKAKDNPWKLTPPALREQIEAMVLALTSPTVEPPGEQQRIVQRPRTSGRHAPRSTKSREAPPIALARERIRSRKPNGALSALDECQAHLKSLEAKVEDLRQQARRCEEQLEAAKGQVTNAEAVELKLEDELAEYRGASRTCASKGDWHGKGQFDVKARGLHPAITAAGLNVANALASVLSLEQLQSEVQNELTAHQQLHARSCAERERLLFQSLKVVPTNPFPFYPTVESVPPLDITVAPAICVVCLMAFIGRCAVICSCGCLLHPYCMWQLIGHPQKVVSRVCPGCGKGFHGAWSAQWGLSLDSAVEIAELNSMISSDSTPNWMPQKGPFFWDLTAGAPQTSVGMKGNNVITRANRMKVMHPRDPESPSDEVSNAAGSPTDLVEGKKQRVVLSRGTGEVREQSSVPNFALPYAVVVASTVESLASRERTQDKVLDIPCGVLEEHTENRSVEGRWEIALRQAGELLPKLEAETQGATEMSNRTACDELHEELVKECIEILHKGRAVESE